MNDNPYNHFSNYPGKGSADQEEASFQELEATELYCPKCRKAVPVRKRLLLILPEGDKYEYLCRFCNSTVGDKIDRGPKKGFI